MRRLGLIVLLSLISHRALADEGMWTYDNFPADKVSEAYGFKPSPEWLEKTRLSSARLAGGCSASFVSSTGLIMTNHHCAHTCIEQLSTARQDYVKNGFTAKSLGDERKCPDMEVNQLLTITDVTSRLEAVTQGKAGPQFAEAQRAEMAKIKQECATSDKLRCDVVTLYQGGQYSLYKYRRFQDVRLVFAPEFDIAFFGGDPDNFNFPRFDLDLSFVRVYEDGKPALMDHYFPFSKQGPKAGELTFVSGHPGRTSREATTSELAYQRDVQLPKRMMLSSELRGMLTEFGRRGVEQKRISSDLLFGTENGLKSARGRHATLASPSFFAQKIKQETELRAQIAAKPELQKLYGSAWDKIEAATQRLRDQGDAYDLIEGARGFDSRTFALARKLVRYAEEKAKPNEQRLREYVDASLPELKQALFSEAPLYDELEIATLSFSLTKLREWLGADDPFVKKVLGKKSPDTLAKEWIKGSNLKSLAERKRLFEGGSTAIAASKDPLIQLARAIDADSRRLRKTNDDDIMSEINRNHELIARARFAIFGKAIYPDATFTLRLSYGAVEGWKEGERTIEPFTTLGGAFERATGEYPFALPASWMKAKNQLNAATPFNFTTNNDIVGGNSGSPVINQKAEIVGLIFDGNLPSLGGTYSFIASNNRAVAVHSSAILETLERVYGAKRLALELKNPGLLH